MIGLTGFDYHFNSLEDETEDVYLAYRRLFDMADKGAPLRTVIELYFPIIRKLWVCPSLLGHACFLIIILPARRT